ncbi:hypothetical protein QQ73_09750, partial [Candidatus Endoriftia persephone str. Guaymas]|nr:hypothetical protein [Candidatus Endoriftia persephone str. Guaymas]
FIALSIILMMQFLARFPSMLRSLLLLLLPLLVGFAYLTFNYATTGHMVPVSGLVKQHFDNHFPARITTIGLPMAQP